VIHTARAARAPPKLDTKIVTMTRRVVLIRDGTAQRDGVASSALARAISMTTPHIRYQHAAIMNRVSMVTVLLTTLRNPKKLNG